MAAGIGSTACPVADCVVAEPLPMESGIVTTEGVILFRRRRHPAIVTFTQHDIAVVAHCHLTYGAVSGAGEMLLADGLFGCIGRFQVQIALVCSHIYGGHL